MQTYSRRMNEQFVGLKAHIAVTFFEINAAALTFIFVWKKIEMRKRSKVFVL